MVYGKYILIIFCFGIPKMCHKNVHTKNPIFRLAMKKIRKRKCDDDDGSGIGKDTVRLPKAQVYNRVQLYGLNFDHGYIHFYWKSMELNVPHTLPKAMERGTNNQNAEKSILIYLVGYFFQEKYSGTNYRCTLSLCLSLNLR